MRTIHFCKVRNCSKYRHRPRDLTRHYKQAHGKTANEVSQILHDCDICDLAFPINKLERHYKTDHRYDVDSHSDCDSSSAESSIQYVNPNPSLNIDTSTYQNDYDSLLTPTSMAQDAIDVDFEELFRPTTDSTKNHVDIYCDEVFCANMLGLPANPDFDVEFDDLLQHCLVWPSQPFNF